MACVRLNEEETTSLFRSRTEYYEGYHKASDSIGSCIVGVVMYMNNRRVLESLFQFRQSHVLLIQQVSLP